MGVAPIGVNVQPQASSAQKGAGDLESGGARADRAIPGPYAILAAARASASSARRAAARSALHRSRHLPHPLSSLTFPLFLSSLYLTQQQGYVYGPAKTVYAPAKVSYNPQKGPVYAPVGDDLTTEDDNIGASEGAGGRTGGGGL